MIDSQPALVTMKNPAELCSAVTTYNYRHVKPGGDVGMKSGCNGSCVPIPNHPRFYSTTEYAYTDYNISSPNAYSIYSPGVKRECHFTSWKQEWQFTIFLPYIFSTLWATLNTIAKSQLPYPTLQQISLR